MLCAPEYPCGILQAIATCTCTAGLFSCKDVAGRQLNPGDSPTCPPGRDAGVCPSTEPVNHAACRESGLVCAYPNSCGNHVYDECQCFPAPPQDGGVDLRFECTSPCFESDAALMGDDGSADADAAGGFDAADVGSIADARDGPSD
jgi:hypothetical protein